MAIHNAQAEYRKEPAMKVLVAENVFALRLSLTSLLEGWGFDVIHAFDGDEAWRFLQAEDAPQIAILGWELAGLNGAEICQKVRESARVTNPYLILLSAKSGEIAITAGFNAGADDLLNKSFDEAELRTRIQFAERVMRLEQTLKERIRQCSLFAAEMNKLKGMLPICMCCKSIRDSQDGWQKLEAYITHYLGVEFSHSVCPECLESQGNLRGGLPRQNLKTEN